MEKLIEKAKEKLSEEIEELIKKPDISPAAMEHLRKAFEILETITRIECCYSEGYSGTSHKHMHGYSGHSVRDRMVSMKIFARNLPTLVGRGIAILIFDVFFYSFFAHIAKSTHIVTMRPKMTAPEFIVLYLRVILKK